MNQNQRNSTVKWLAQGAMIASLYVVLTLVFAPISFGAVQVRIAEVMTILPLFTSAAIPGLFIGCVLANLLGDCACNYNDNDEWLPMSCKYAETECPKPKEIHGCWKQFLLQGAYVKGVDFGERREP